MIVFFQVICLIFFCKAFFLCSIFTWQSDQYKKVQTRQNTISSNAQRAPAQDDRQEQEETGIRKLSGNPTHLKLAVIRIPSGSPPPSWWCNSWTRNRVSEKTSLCLPPTPTLQISFFRTQKKFLRNPEGFYLKVSSYFSPLTLCQRGEIWGNPLSLCDLAS